MLIPKRIVEEAFKRIEELDKENDELYEANIKLSDTNKKLFLENRNLKEKYLELESELKNQISLNYENNKKIQDLEIKIWDYKGLFKEVDSKWNIFGDRIIRFNPIKEKIERYDIPYPNDFDEAEIIDFEIFDDFTWCSFKYKEDLGSSKTTFFEMPSTAAQEIGISIEKLFGNKGISNIKQINSEKDLIKYLKKNNINIETNYWKSVIDFIIFYRKAEFETSEFINDCKFGNKESARIYLNKLINIGLIKRVKKGVYKVLFDFY
jgi:hypothetical protein